MTKKIINILHISFDFNYSCGVSKYVFSLIEEFGKNESYKIYIITNGGDAIDKFYNINVNPIIINFSNGVKNIFHFCNNLRFLNKFCIENKIDLIHTHHRYPEFLANLISKRTGIKTITTVHSLVKGKRKASFKSDKIIAVSNSVKKMLIDYFKVPDEKITMLYNFLDTPDLAKQNINLNIKSELGIPTDYKVILFLGRITKIKGVDLLIEAFKIVRRKDRKVFLLIIGQIYDNSLNVYLNSLPDGVKLLGTVKNPYPYYKIADLVVLPSRIDPFPYVMLEAGLMRKPFIGSNTGGLAEFIEDGVNGLLFESGNVNQLADKIEFILYFPEKSEAMVENLYNKVVKNCSYNEYFNKLNKIYNELVI